MNELTKEQRRDIYLKAYEVLSLKTNDTCGCYVLSIASGFNGSYELDFIASFPEYMLFAPDGYSIGTGKKFYSDYATEKEWRLTALLLCAEMCKS